MAQLQRASLARMRMRERRALEDAQASTASTSSSSAVISSAHSLSTVSASSSSSSRSFVSSSTSSVSASSSTTLSSLVTSISSSTVSRTSSPGTPPAVPTSTGAHARPPSTTSHDRFPTISSSGQSSSSSSANDGPLYTPLILMPDAASSSSSSASSTPDSSGSPSGKRSVGGVSMGVGVLIGALALAALLIPGFFVYRKISRSRRARVWNRRRRLTHIDPGARVGEHVEKYPVSPFVAGQPAARQTSIMYISDVGARDEESRTPRSGATPVSADVLLAPLTPSPNPTASSRTVRPAALELGRARSGTTHTVRQSTADGAVEFTLGASPPLPASVLASSTVVQSAAPPGPNANRSSIEKRPARTLVAQNALSPLPTPLVTPAPRYSQSPPTLWARLSAIRHSAVPPAYESPRPHQTAHHLQVPPPRSHLRAEVPVTDEESQEGTEPDAASAGAGWAPLRVQRRPTLEDAPRLPRQSFDGRGRI